MSVPVLTWRPLQVLAKDGADLHTVNAEGKTPLELAQLHGKRQIAAILEEGLQREGILQEVSQVGSVCLSLSPSLSLSLCLSLPQ